MKAGIAAFIVLVVLLACCGFSCILGIAPSTITPTPTATP